ncbi:hypothetical protein ABAC460_00385 [Asticcacaulis sp. AC460]|uniref:RidA family protein n=1 Tax=Asticcacaulis sp. AC460 TaxID=1282360 RepID=UPI0003C40BF0|nr:RidA family protein [Asticcacaulis sp. AC460]ESQ93559.1 hypothetical protein ABAC460_00385 [Asticcacaulis sp. AC460]
MLKYIPLLALAPILSGCLIYSDGEGEMKVTRLKDVEVAPAVDVKRTYAGAFPIAQSIVVPPGYSTVYLSGMVPGPVAGTTDQFGNTEVQTESVLKKIEAALQAEGLGFGDVVNMKVYLVGDPALGGKMDFGGMMKSYTRYFGTETQPNKPTRTTVQVAGLANAAFLVEIEVVAVKKAE